MSDVRVYEYDGGFTVANGSGWYPGIYATEAAARYAPRLWRVLGERTDANLRGVGDDYRPVRLDELQAWESQGSRP